MLNACLRLRSHSDIRHTQCCHSSLSPCCRDPGIQLQHGCLRGDPAKIMALENDPISATCPNKPLFFFHTPSFSPSCPDPTELPKLSQRVSVTHKTWGSKNVMNYSLWVLPGLQIPCPPLPRPFWCVSAPSQTQLFFPPLNHLRVKSLSSRSSPINVANMTHHIPLPGTTDQRPGPSVWAPEIAGWLGLPCHPAGQLQALTQVFETCLPVW